jgi:endonuclease/exonuclease/phosphatase family metal-dependent hydrolase
MEAKQHEVIEVGHAVFSKFPLKNAVRYALDTEKDYYHLLGVDVALKPDLSMRLFTTHLASVSLKGNEVDFAEVKTRKLPTEVDAETKNILLKIVKASSLRAMQANAIDSIVKRQDLPLVICGDFNDMPGAYAYHTIKGNLKDAFVSRGFGLGRTYRKIFPTLRIDYILYDESILSSKAYSTPNVNLSDHNPVIATFSVKNKKEKNN